MIVEATYFLRCLKRNTAVLKLTGGKECNRVSNDCSRASGSDRPVENTQKQVSRGMENTTSRIQGCSPAHTQ